MAFARRQGMNRAAWCVLLLASLALAGCAGDEPSEEEKFKEAVEHGAAADVPVWQVGDYWTYEASAGERVLGTSSFVVTGEQGGDYIVETNDKDIAYFDARFDISFMGQIRKSDLAGSQNGQRIEMFQWPISADLAWTTDWDDETLDMEAMDMGPNQWHVMGHRQSDGAMVVDYHYNAAKKWFEYIIFYDADNGTEGFRLDLKDNGLDFKGTIYRYSFGDIHALAATAQQSGIGSLTIGEEWNEIGVSAMGTCGGDPAGGVAVGINTPSAPENPVPMLPILNDPEWGRNINCADQPAFDEEDVLFNEGGEWEVGFIVGTPNGMAHLFLEERSLEAASFP